MKIIIVRNLAEVPQFYPTGIMSLHGKNSIK